MDELFLKITAKQVLKFLTGESVDTIDIKVAAQTSFEILGFDATDEDLLNNDAFIKSWGMLRVKSTEVLQLISALLVLKNQYKISNFDFALALEGIEDKDAIERN